MRQLLKYDKWFAFLSIPVFIAIYGAFKPVSNEKTVIVVRLQTAEQLQKYILNKTEFGYKLVAIHSYYSDLYTIQEYVISMEK